MTESIRADGLQVVLYCFYDFLYEERLSLYLVVLLVLELWHNTAEIIDELAAVELTYEDLIIF